MYTRVLVPLDESPLAEQALPYARLLGKSLDSPIQLLRVVELPSALGLINPAGESHRNQLIADLTGQAQKYLKETADSLRDGDLAVSSMVHHGDPASDIVDEAEMEPDTIIAMSTHGRSGLARWVFGSVMDKVLHATSKPLLIIRPREEMEAAQQVTLKTVIVPLDESPLAEQALHYVVPLAKALDLKVILVRVTPSSEEYYRFMDFPPRDFDTLSRDIDGQAVEYLRRIGRKLLQQGVSSLEERLLHGHPATAIVNLSRETPENLVAMTTHGRSGIGRWVLGSVADRVVRHSGSPVLLIRAAQPKAG